MPASLFEVDVLLGADEARGILARDVRAALAARPRELPCKYFYDERGGKLFERITELPEYDLTRNEEALLRRHAPAIAERTQLVELLELGAGSSRKTRLLIEAGRAARTLQRYVPFDVSWSALERSGQDLARLYPGLEVHAVVGDYDRHLGRLPRSRARLVAFLGSTVGNFAGPAAVGFLRRVAALLEADGWLLLGTDLVKPRAELEAAYDDAAGLTAAFNRNILTVINRELGADFVPDAFEHVARYDERAGWVEMNLRSTRAQRVRIGALGLELEFAAGELLRTEVSCKYTRPAVEALLAQAGFALERWMTDPAERYALSLARLSAGGPGPGAPRS
ncbi:MAG TPA: L-histidine N(alpha)-methyltransferase [Candidatus Polarisedimenticolaceae bacterium]|nr:L-histidine N(alpha)-methyltransferase [Candidatus Polarisedimenticolaceae bacterium]